ncbi:MAG: UDP-N-acetylmuramoyl-tripeptide--D-alanyl-D-alanine ligase [Gammaproteobacteria bacterium]|nr:UDP-N-acetylmuramoyl-tripeptide--D-alanyl-D-alanine ligase [Gammaproteobacteria bacterium]
MSVLRFSELAAMVDGRMLGADCEFDGVSTDTRTLRSGELFIALRGPNFDGHDYLQAAREGGAAGAMVEHIDRADMPLVEVADTLLGLGRLGQQWRLQRPARVIGITGSNGKTTLKEMTTAILSRRGSVLATRGNLNNEIGVPLTLSRLRDEHYAVVEMGANHPGEIDYLSGLVRPDIAVLNNAGRAHLEGFGSIEGVARAKAEIISGLAPDGVFVFNADDRFAGLWAGLGARYSRMTFGVAAPADVSSPAPAYEVVWRGGIFHARFPVVCAQGEIEVHLQLAGEHNRMNALAAIAASLAAGADLADAQQALAGLEPVAGRLCPVAGPGGARVIDDSYNANPDSVVAALRVLSAAPGRRTLVLGDLAELGTQAQQLHRELGERAAEFGIDRLLTIGEFSRHAGLSFSGEHRHYTDHSALADELMKDLSEEDSVLVKGSRAAHMEDVVERLRAREIAC